jgi:ArsR family transcriptional regulator, arsenate/arsenite/antimonite-responsive transcriptional repressor
MIDIVPLFKVLADETRIRILALITERALSVEEIAAAVDLSSATVSHHLQRLKEAGLVEAERQQYYTVYRFHRQPLLDALRLAANPPTPPDLADDLAKYDQKVLGDYLVAGKLKTIPAQRKKRDVILRYPAEQFAYDRDYSEQRGESNPGCLSRRCGNVASRVDDGVPAATRARRVSEGANAIAG